MAIKLLQIWGRVERPWGYEVRADYDVDGKIQNEVLNWEKQPEEKDIVAAADKLRVHIKERLASAKSDVNKTALQDELISVENEIAAAETKKASIVAQLAIAQTADGKP